MRNQFAVVSDGIAEQVVFEGDDSSDVYTWLRKNSAFYASGFKVVDRSTSTSWSEKTFISEFEEQMTKAYAVIGKHVCLSEDRIRVIIRDEMSKSLESISNGVSKLLEAIRGGSQYGDC